MAIHLRVLAAAALLLALAASAAAVGDEPHDMLSKFGLPIGLLPDSVKSYSLSGNGEFELELESPCYTQFSDLVHYERSIKGRLSYGAITDLTGIQVRKFFVWMPVTGIVAHPSESTVELQAGFLSEMHPVSEFKDILKCKAEAACRGTAGIVSDVLPIAEV